MRVLLESDANSISVHSNLRLDAGDIVQIIMERKENNYLVPRFVE